MTTQKINTWDNQTLMLWATTHLHSDFQIGLLPQVPVMPQEPPLRCQVMITLGSPLHSDRLHCFLAPMIPVVILEFYVIFHLEKKSSTVFKLLMKKIEKCHLTNLSRSAHTVRLLLSKDFCPLSSVHSPILQKHGHVPEFGQVSIMC